ncbi:hypothetical protein [Spiroplasma sp. SV19]|uniref:hypothetical protein n=1 Tax=Spiroplasma sp. SV19 TaxID=2570468 RepID=UPI0024B79D4E|nr:hypothetical protein [Spiroplasma sp. SV19]WHQ36918.1 hypothetical protein E7Y35_03330 [Spiroplasma sp. SV19]
MNDKVILNYNKLCEKCKNIFQKIMLSIKAKNPELLKTVEFYQVIIDEEATVASDVLPFALIKHDDELYGFFLHHDLSHLNHDAKQLLQTGVIKLPSSVLTAVQNRTINLDQQLMSVASQQKSEMIINDDSNDVTQAIAQLNANQQQIIQGLTTSLIRFKQRHQKITRIFILLGVILVLLFTGIGIGGWQLYLYLHRATQPVTFDLNQITKIASPMMINAINPKQVQGTEVKSSLKYLIFQEVAGHSRGATFADYDYQLFANNSGAVYQPVNLTTNGVEIWVMITAFKNSKFLINNSPYLSVMLPTLGEGKVSIADVKTLDGPELFAAPTPEKVTESDIRQVYDAVVQAAIKPINDKAQLNVDYYYDLYADENEGPYQSLNLASGSDEVWIVITANSTSKVITGYTVPIKVILQTHKKFASLNDSWIFSMVRAVDGTLYVGTANSNVWTVAVDGVVTKFASLNDIRIGSIVLASDGMLYVGTGNSNVWAVAVDGVVTKFASLNDIRIGSIVLASDGTLYVGTRNSNVWAVAVDGVVTKFASLNDNWIISMVFSLDGTLYVGTRNSNVWAVAADGVVTKFASLNDDWIRSMVFSPNGSLYIGTDASNMWAIAVIN